jgi:hypothetical protein
LIECNELVVKKARDVENPNRHVIFNCVS